MRQLKVEKIYDKFKETTEILVGNQYFHFWYYADPNCEKLVFSNSSDDFFRRTLHHWGSYDSSIYLIDDYYRYQSLSPLSQEDLLRFCNAKSVEVNLRYGTDYERTLTAKSAVPAAKLMYNTLYSANFFNEDDIQREWLDTGWKVEKTKKQRVFLQENGWPIFWSILVLGSIAGLIIWMLKYVHAI